MNQYPKNIFQAIILLLIGIVSVVPFVFIKEVLDFKISTDLYNQFLFLILFIAISIIYGIKNRSTFIFNQFWKNGTKLSPKTGLFLLLFLIIFQFGVNIPLSKYLAFNINEENNITNQLNNIGIIIGALLLAPICEEIVFRGMILKGFLQTYSPITAICFSTFIFSIIHVHPTLLFGALVLGMLLGYIYYITNSVFSGIVFHAAANLITIFGGYLLFRFYGNNRIEAIYGSMTILVILVSVILCTGIGFILKGKKRIL